MVSMFDSMYWSWNSCSGSFPVWCMSLSFLRSEVLYVFFCNLYSRENVDISYTHLHVAM
jgi:hypothetical protein